MKRIKKDDIGNITDISDDLTSPLSAGELTEAVSNDAFFFMHSESPKTQLIINIIVSTLIGGFIFLILFLRGLFSPFLFLGVYAFVLIYMILDYIYWLKRGIKSIYLNNEGINLNYMSGSKEEFIPYSDVTDLNLFKKGARIIVNIMLGGKQNKIPAGITIFSGKRKRITNDSFKDEEFNNFIRLVSSRVKLNV